MACHATSPTFEINPDDIATAAAGNSLLTMEIEFSLHCNYNCLYCYVGQDEFLPEELTFDEIRDVIGQAKDMGAKKIILLGGEPMLYPDLFEHIEFITGQGMEVEMFTNGSNMTPENAARLFKNNVRVVLKKNSFKEDVQDELSGKKGAYQIIETALTNLKQAGYPTKNTVLAVSTVICKQNFDELVPLWTWCRDQGILPYFEMITPQGRANANAWMQASSRDVAELFEKLAKIDRENYGINWEPQPPLVGNRCMRHQFSCVVTVSGDVIPCVGITIPVGNIRHTPLQDIIADSDVICDLKNYKSLIKGPCRDCEKSDQCYGCRGAAFQLTGDYLASDPLCWKNCDKADQIQRLPVSLSGVIPQKFPMRIVDQLEALEERRATVSTTITEDNPFINGDGRLDRSVFMEMMAQSIAAENCFKHLADDQFSMEGFLVGGRDLKVYADAGVGDQLTIEVTKLARMGEFGVIHGTVHRQDELLAEGEIKIWHRNALPDEESGVNAN